MAIQQDTSPSAVHDHNRRAWDQFARNQSRFTKPITDREFDEALQGICSDPWFEGRLHGARLVCLGSGGGRQSALYAAAGACVTVVDISAEMLAVDRQVVANRGLDVAIVQASIDDLRALPRASFDFAVQPVSTCYVPDVVRVYEEVARILIPGAVYVSQHKQPASLQAEIKPSPRGGYEVRDPYYRSGPLATISGSPHREEGTLEFLHRWEQLIGGLCRAGFVVEDLVEPLHARPDAEAGSFAHRSQFVPPYVRIKARRTAVAAPTANLRSGLWID